MCSGNTDSAEDVDCSGEATNTQNKGDAVTGSDVATCCKAPCADWCADSNANNDDFCSFAACAGCTDLRSEKGC